MGLSGGIGLTVAVVATPAALQALVVGIGLGIGAAAPIGPVNVEIARRSIRNGFGAGFALGLGAVTVDVGYAIVTSLGWARLVDQRALYWPMTLAGIALLAWLGIGSLRSAWRGAKAVGSAAANVAPLDEPPAPSLHGGYISGLLMTLLNPMTLAFWFVVVPAAGSIASAGRARQDLPMICLGVFLATVGWVVGFAGLLSLASRGAVRRRRGAMIVAADALGGCILLLFASLAFLRSLGPLL